MRAAGASSHPAAPPAPHGYAMLAHESRTGRVVMFGGVLEAIEWPNEPTVDETWIFDLARGSWERGSARRAPGPRAWHQMVGVGKGVLLFGGGSSRFEYTSEAYTYGSRSDVWKQVATCR